MNKFKQDELQSQSLCDSLALKYKLTVCIFQFFCSLSFLLWLSLQVAEGVKETFFRSLEDLIRHYKRRNQGLAMHLCHAVKRKTTLLKQPVCHAETQGPVCLPEQQCVYDGKTRRLFFSTEDFPFLFLLSCIFQQILIILTTWRYCLTEQP